MYLIKFEVLTVNYYFRKLRTTDIENLWSLIEILKREKVDMSFAEIQNKNELLDFIDNPAELTYIAVTKENPMQVLCLVKGKRKLSKDKSHSVLLSAATHPNARGHGLVAKLTNFALEEMKNEGVTIARSYVYSNNTASLNAIKKLDFIHAGTIIRHHRNSETGEYVDDLIFHKILD